MPQITVQRALEIAHQHQQAGRTAEAETLFRLMQDTVGDNPIALHGLGTHAQKIGLEETSLRLFRKAAALRPDMAEAHNAIGELTRAQEKTAESLDAFQRAAAGRPDNPEYLCNAASSLRAMGRVSEAIAISSRMIALEPGRSASHFEMGRDLEENGQPADAIISYRQAIELQPKFAPAWHHLGLVLRMQNASDEAIEALQRAVDLDPRNAKIQLDLACFRHEAGQFSKGAEAFARAIGIGLSDVNPSRRVRDPFFDTGIYETAIDCFRRTIALEPDNVWAHCNLAWILHELGEVNEAIALHKRAIQLTPENSLLYENLINSMRVCDAISYEDLLQEHQRWAERFAGPLARHIPVHGNDPSPDRVLRLGYVSPDLRSHPVGAFILPILMTHNREKFNITCYSNSRSDDMMSRRMRASVDAWHVTADWSDEKLAAQIIDDRIDVLVDLAQHTAGNRMLVFARKPAPVQLTYLGYPGTTGLKTFDAQISDPYIDPPGRTEHYSTEPIERLPQTYWCFHPIRDVPPVGPTPAISAGYITFGCLNKLEKSSPAAMRLWARILTRVERSRLILIAPPGSHRQRIFDLFSAQGIDPQRIELTAKQPIHDYFALYGRIDIALDPIPYNGGTTTCQALWMGVPVITLAGTAGVQRSGVSLLSNAGLSELVATTPEQYVQIAFDLADDLPRLSSLRQGIRERMTTSPLMDAPRFTGNLEAIYRKLWKGWCARSQRQ